MQLSAESRREIKHAVESSSNTLFTTRADSYVPVIEKKLIAIASSWLTMIRIAVKSNPERLSGTFEEKQIHNDSTLKLVKNVVGRILDFTVVSSCSYVKAKGEVNSLNGEIFSQHEMYQYGFSVSWTPGNKYVYSNQPLAELLDTQSGSPKSEYTLEDHFNKLGSKKNKANADVTICFEGRTFEMHSQILSAYANASDKLVEERTVRFPQFVYESIYNFVYDKKMPPANLNMKDCLVLKEAMDLYEFEELQKWTNNALEKHLKTLSEPDADFQTFAINAIAIKSEALVKECFKIAEANPVKLDQFISIVDKENLDFLTDLADESTPKAMKSLMHKMKSFRSDKSEAPTSSMPRVKPVHREHCTLQG